MIVVDELQSITPAILMYNSINSSIVIQIYLDDMRVLLASPPSVCVGLSGVVPENMHNDLTAAASTRSTS